MVEFITKDGKKVQVNAAPFSVSMALKNAIEKALLENDIDLAGMEVEEKQGAVFLKNPATTIKILMAIDSNAEVERCLFIALERCTYGGHKITRDTFEEMEARRAYYEIVIACVKENILPFYGPLFSTFKSAVEKNTANQKQASTSATAI